MAVNRTFQAIITVLDRTAAPLRVIQQRLRGLAPATLTVGQNLRLMQDRLMAIAQSPAMQRVGDSVRQVGNRLRGLLGTIGRVGIGFVAMAATVGLSVGGMVGLGRATLNSAGRMSDLMARTGMTVVQLRGLEFAAGMAGVEMDSALSSVERLNRGMAEAADGKNQGLAALFQRLGISLRDSSGQIRTATDVLPQLADAFQQNENAAVRARMAAEMFGRGGMPLIAMLQQGGAALRAQMAEGFALNPQINDGNVNAIDAAEDAYTKLGRALEGVRDAIFVRLLPSLEPMIVQMTAWAVANQNTIGQDVAGWIERVATQIGAWDWAGFVTGMKDLAIAIGRVVTGLGGMENTLKLLGAIALAPLFLSVLGVAFAVLKVLAGIASFAAALSPAGWIVAGVTALAAVGTLLYNTWKPFADLIDSIVSALGRMATQQPGRVPGEGQQNFGQRGSALGHYAPGPLLDPDTGEPAFGPRARPQSAPGAPATGPGRLVVEFQNMPRDARVRQEQPGRGPALDLDVGFALMGAP